MRERKKAMAVGYEAGDLAPRLLAGGEGERAEYILRLARENGIPIREDRDIVKVLEVLGDGAYIPEELYQAFATLLASLYAASKKLGKNDAR
jgi:flagellar biosynthesis protein